MTQLLWPVILLYILFMNICCVSCNSLLLFLFFTVVRTVNPYGWQREVTVINGDFALPTLRGDVLSSSSLRRLVYTAMTWPVVCKPVWPSNRLTSGWTLLRVHFSFPSCKKLWFNLWTLVLRLFPTHWWNVKMASTPLVHLKSESLWCWQYSVAYSSPTRELSHQYLSIDHSGVTSLSNDDPWWASFLLTPQALEHPETSVGWTLMFMLATLHYSVLVVHISNNMYCVVQKPKWRLLCLVL